jgi:thiol-disulfide isomerase/thioredoxin
MSRRTMLVLAACVVVVAAGAVFAATRGGSPAAAGDWPPGVEIVPLDERRPLPGFSGDAVTGGGRVDLGKLDGPVVLNFWASWCGPCRAEQRGLEQASRQLAGDGVKFVGVNIRDDRAAAAAYLKEFSVSYPSLYDRPGKLAAALGRDAPPAPPTTLVVDAKGRVAARIVGTLPGGSVPAGQAAELARIVRAVTAG